ncbi:hypothetical protein [Kribbella sp. NPDC049584]|uniref:hypothetical protein n=1 Tax=Kribbella sp. NPDC049584 TaxID=3154833 RepID=UPI00342AA40D
MTRAPAVGADLVTDPRAVAQIQAARTRAASGPTTRPLSPPALVAPDLLFGATGRLRPHRAYDLGLEPPSLPAGAAGAQIQHLGLDDTIAATLDKVLGTFPSRKPTSTGVRRILGWLHQFDGETWEQRWMASGADLAPRAWRSAVTPRTPNASVAQGVNALMVARVLRPSYGWQLATGAGAYLPQRMLGVNDAEQLERLRSLPAYRSALLRHQYDAEACLSRVLIRTGKRLEELQGEDLLFYADVVRTSGRTRREHLAWELLVALGPFAGEPLTLRAAWSAKGNSRQHSVQTLVDRYGVPASGVRDLLIDYLSELKPSMDYGTLEGWAYRLVRLFWWEVLQINPGQADLRLTPQVAAEWRERLSVTIDGQPRRQIHST